MDGQICFGAQPFIACEFGMHFLLPADRVREYRWWWNNRSPPRRENLNCAPGGVIFCSIQCKGASSSPVSESDKRG
jgi:hypothetical protein